MGRWDITLCLYGTGLEPNVLLLIITSITALIDTNCGPLIGYAFMWLELPSHRRRQWSNLVGDTPMSLSTSLHHFLEKIGLISTWICIHMGILLLLLLFSFPLVFEYFYMYVSYGTWYIFGSPVNPVLQSSIFWSAPWQVAIKSMSSYSWFFVERKAVWI